MNRPLNIGCSLRLFVVAVLVLAGLSVCSVGAMDVVLVVDTSGSMGWDVAGNNRRSPEFSGPSRIDRVTSALKRYLTLMGQLPADQGVRLRLISFNSGIKTNKEFLLSNPSDLKAALSTVENLKSEVRPDGDTWLWEALRTGISEATAYAKKDPDVTVCLFVLTDGEYDNKSPDREKDISFSKVSGESPLLGGEALYGSLVLLGKLKGADGKGSFSTEYVEGLKQQAGGKFDIQLSEDFSLILPPIIAESGKIVAGESTVLMDRSLGDFKRYEWQVDGKPVGGTDRALDIVFPKDGKYVVTVKAYDDHGRRARARKVVVIRGGSVAADPQISVNGKPLAEAGEIHPGDKLTLLSRSTKNGVLFLWEIGGEKLEGQVVQWTPSSLGKVTIRHRVTGAKSSTGETPMADSAPIQLNVLPHRLSADPQISVNGKPLVEAGEIHPGDKLTLISRNTAHAEAFLWEVNGEKLEGQTVEWTPARAGRVKISHAVTGGRNGKDEPQVSKSAPIQIEVVNRRITPKALVLDRGKPIEQVDVFAGDTLKLVSESAGPVVKTIWKVNGSEIEGTMIDYKIEKAGPIRIQLMVLGSEGEPVASGEISILAKKRPAYWSLVALGILELGIFSFLWYFFTGNQLKYCKLKATSGIKPLSLSGVKPNKYWSRLHKTASIPFKMLFKDDEYWSKQPNSDRKCLTISRALVSLKGPLMNLGCTFSNTKEGLGDIVFGEDEGKQTKDSRVYNFSDNTDPEKPRRIQFEVTLGRPRIGDGMALVFSSSMILASYFYFYLKIYPNL
jgi:hypothetical protein